VNHEYSYQIAESNLWPTIKVLVYFIFLYFSMALGHPHRI